MRIMIITIMMIIITKMIKDNNNYTEALTIKVITTIEKQ